MGIEHNGSTTVLPYLPDPGSHLTLLGSTRCWIYSHTLNTGPRYLQRIDTHGRSKCYWAQVRLNQWHLMTVPIYFM
jgi:hypothetical protein